MWSSTHQVGAEYCFPDLRFRELCIFELSNKKKTDCASFTLARVISAFLDFEQNYS